MREDPDSDRRLFNCGDDSEFAATLRAVFEVELEHALEQAGPAHPRWCAVRMFVSRFALRWARHDRRTQPGIGREHAVKADQVQARAWHQSGPRLARLWSACVDAGAELTRCAGFNLTRVRPMSALVSR